MSMLETSPPVLLFVPDVTSVFHFTRRLPPIVLKGSGLLSPRHRWLPLALGTWRTFRDAGLPPPRHRRLSCGLAARSVNRRLGSPPRHRRLLRDLAARSVDKSAGFSHLRHRRLSCDITKWSIIRHARFSSRARIASPTGGKLLRRAGVAPSLRWTALSVPREHIQSLAGPSSLWALEILATVLQEKMEQVVPARAACNIHTVTMRRARQPLT